MTDDQTWLNKLRPEFRDSINHPRDPANTTPTNNPTTSANTSEDRGDVGTISQGYHRTRVGRTLLSAALISSARPASSNPPRTSTSHGILTTGSFRIKSSRSQFRRRNLRLSRRVLPSLGQERRKGSHPPGGRLPRSQSQLLRHRRRVFSRRIERNPRQSNRRTPQHSSNLYQGHVRHGQRPQRSRLLPLSPDPVL